MAKCGSGLQMTLSWVPASNGIVPQGAIDIGQNIFVARAMHAGEFIPGKLTPAAGQTYVPYAGVEHGVPQYQVLCVTGVNCGKCYKWSPAEGGHVPKNSVVAAIAGDGGPVYIARAEVEGEKLVGKVHSGHSNAYFPHKGKEIPVANYEVLVWMKK
uniref:DM9-2 n=1 Tax=Fasciola gigantica TaxID=46835 RepID=A0A142BYJ5_FASGI|nr:DM9-2 [Fasciola gigantica]